MEALKNYIDNTWTASANLSTVKVLNPATQELLAEVPIGSASARDMDQAIKSGHQAHLEWKKVPVMRRVQPLFKLKRLMDENLEDLAQTITLESGKTLEESKGELMRAIENIETACGTPMLMQSEFSEDIASGVDEFMIRQALGVTACIAPFNFPAMITFWFLPYAIACGNAMVVKPSEKVPLTMIKIFHLIDQLDLPKGLVNMVHGGKEAVDVLLEHSLVKAISFVGSTDVAKYIYAKGAQNGKRVQAQ
jgi:malonate-semialdehyde dehydrogenase (acetylating)/methylmalonate-semialdehyde dehydrogenase